MTAATGCEVLCVFDPATPGTRSIDVVARVTGVPRHRIGVYCRTGLLTTVGDPARDGWRFDQTRILRLRDVEAVRERFGANLDVIKVILRLSGELADLRHEVRRMRDGAPIPASEGRRMPEIAARR